MYSFKLIARPDELLIDHLVKVAEISIERFRSIKHNLTEILNQKDWKNLVYITGFSHDFGKATSFFQKYVKAEPLKQAKLRNHPETHHGLLSGVFTYWIITNYLNQPNVKTEHNLTTFLPFLFFLIVKKHHGNLTNPVDDELNSPGFSYLKNQLNHIDTEELQHILNILSDKINLKIELSDFPSDIDLFIKSEFKSLLKNTSMRKIFPKQYPGNIENYILFQFLNSILLHADKSSVILSANDNKRLPIDDLSVDNYKTKAFGQPKSEMDRIREDIYKDAIENIVKIDLSHKIFSLNVPTGTGKTLTALSVALKLRQRIEREKGYSPRIIYSLPFTSIIDQNYDVFQKVFYNPSSDLLLKHHSLADVFYRSSSPNDKEYDVNKSMFLIESWESEIIVTTFVQLFHTLLTNSNRALKKFHKFANSIILLDEVQTIPIKYWFLVRNIFKALSKVLNTHIILITATQPRIFSGSDLKEIVPQKDKYFDKLNRVNLEFCDDELMINDFCKMLLNDITKLDESFLIVLNTISSSLEVFNFLNEKEPENRLCYLSTNIIPKERLKRIKKIKEKNGRKIIVSTQLIEAGVDIDVENVWRDFGPLDSINQASGRCNRNLGNKMGTVKIFQLKNEKGAYFYRYIYGDSVLSILQTKSLFKDKISFQENEFLNNIDAYYKEIENKMSNAESEKIIQNVIELNFEEIAKFALIENDEYYKQDVFVEIDKDAQKVWQKFSDLRSIENPFDRKNQFMLIKKQLYEYVISVPKKCLPDGYNDGIYYLCKDQIKEFYDPITGFKLDKQLPQKTEMGFY